MRRVTVATLSVLQGRLQGCMDVICHLDNLLDKDNTNFNFHV